MTFLLAVVVTPVMVIRIVLAALMLVSGIAAIVLVLMQKSNSDGTSALSGGSDSSDTFYAKNKSKRAESKVKTWTYISAIALAVCSIVFFILGL